MIYVVLFSADFNAHCYPSFYGHATLSILIESWCSLLHTCPLFFSDCTMVLTAKSGVAESPGYNNSENYPHNLNCMYTIIATDNTSYIELKFKEFSLESEMQCQYDYLEVWLYPSLHLC